METTMKRQPRNCLFGLEFEACCREAVRLANIEIACRRYLADLERITQSARKVCV